MQTTVAAPERTLAQRMEALQRANDVRSFRADLKQRIRQGGQTTVEMLEAPPESIETMKVFELLLATPKYGRVKVNKILGQCRISPSKTVGGLSERQRGEIIGMLRRPGTAPRPVGMVRTPVHW